MNRDTQRAKAEAFRAMHDRSRILVLPNAWDAMSARVIEEAGARAIATTSAGVAFSVGYPDGEAIPRDEMIAAIARIARVTTIPVTADIESGFARDAREVRRNRSPRDRRRRGRNQPRRPGSRRHPFASTTWMSPSSACARRAKRLIPPACRS